MNKQIPHIMDNSIAAMTLDGLRQRYVLLEEENAKFRKQITELTTQVNWFMEQFKLAKHRQFGASSDTVPGQEQLSIFNEPEREAEPESLEPHVETITYTRRKQKGHREAVLKDLPVDTIEYRLPQEEQVCPNCVGQLHEMSTDVPPGTEGHPGTGEAGQACALRLLLPPV